ncbi:hypothetical protein CEXT_673101 [Caerostris extrusa]|uniref:Uncharacterized protein n=1 Tax=Caerostris extrusa TaxID=172846 RepID=A0AAV4VXS1_CAEEX|nr:hypothetical protein CEXT_673101 [Caerostris extrusa]
MSEDMESVPFECLATGFLSLHPFLPTCCFQILKRNRCVLHSKCSEIRERTPKNWGAAKSWTNQSLEDESMDYLGIEGTNISSFVTKVSFCMPTDRISTTTMTRATR